MDTSLPLALLGGLSADTFMRRHWHKKPLLVRGAIASPGDLLPARADLLAMAARDDVESRLIVGEGAGWKMRHGPLARRALPSLNQPRWTLLVQGLDLHHDGAHGLLKAFGFLPAARLDDVMVSFATDGGGVGPHFDSYDVFLLQTHGRRRWRIGKQKDLSLRDDVPLKVLANFEPEQEFVLEPGDMLYLPPRYAHDGIAEGECMTCSIGFRAPRRGELAQDILQRMAEHAAEGNDALYADPRQPAVANTGAIPAEMEHFARAAVAQWLEDRDAVACALGEYLTEPKSQVRFEQGAAFDPASAAHLDRRTRMLYDARHIFINGESFLASGRDARLMRKLADRRRLDAADMATASAGAREILADWCEDGWLRQTS
ncbi:JmjC domain-containing protein [Xylophilus ampelinus]|uniref:50S ribosomal protein L16 3-hydroxylase n=1 Tax=Xylophilus ampelinus TaxID=54067 RepID=A0A318SQD5_9BURK|nr:cupin domain-containing protein [Xylophilus ampelinus]MCS4508964.1 cupin domain-containing protein [Xylophilus ampelinus]PYE79529.1 50S ribosomal protein L16 3-hydroxylase [Xylophilus ampelinus]